ncbi:MarR family winged helix-turn-helix transcriptional regulator [Metabacillus sp. RGM 3146]|uniref:MarR family winged helix-turn-helix transcriptional regulator n=1 Tax=Metabacillus sp. RGM 3146 TaxID=3401092 RepID=UPI003B9BBD5B
MENTLENIEHEIALLSRLTTALNPKKTRLDRSGYLLLSKLSLRSPQAINAIADDLKLDVSTASRQIASLEDKGFVVRFPDENNRRISLIEITQKGKTVYQDVKNARSKAYSQILKEWPGEDLDLLEKMLKKLNQSLIHWDR